MNTSSNQIDLFGYVPPPEPEPKIKPDKYIRDRSSDCMSSYVNFDGYHFNPEIAWPRINIKPNFFTEHLSFISRPSHRKDSFITDQSGNQIRILCKCCKTPLNVTELANHQVKCNSCLNLENNSQSSDLSKAARNRLQIAFDWLYLLSQEKKDENKKYHSKYKFKIALLTIKLPVVQFHSDLYIKKNMLNNFLTQMRKKYDLNLYLWRAEKGYDGILHFHIIHDKFLPYLEMNKIWNKILDTHGYITEYRHHQVTFHNGSFKFRPEYASAINPFTNKPQKIWNYAQQKKAYEKGVAENWSNPTSTTDIHSVRQIRNTKAYLSQYIQKKSDVKAKVKSAMKFLSSKMDMTSYSPDELESIQTELSQNFEITGNQWYISQPLSKLKGIIIEVTNEISDYIFALSEKFKDKFKLLDHCRLFCFSIKDLISEGFTPLISAIDEYISQVRNLHYEIKNQLYFSLGIPLTLSI